MDNEYKWCRCPVCGYNRMLKLREDTVIKNLPMYCKRCKKETLITIEPKSRIVNP